MARKLMVWRVETADGYEYMPECGDCGKPFRRCGCLEAAK